MASLMESALSANAASLGLNWIYNIPYLEKLAQKEPLFFQPIDPAKYKRARKAVNAYPKAQVGDVSLQGRILIWLDEHLRNGGDFTPEAYKKLVYAHIKPGGPYEGWVESYGKKLIYNHLGESLKSTNEPLAMDDDELIGFIPYIVAKIHGKTNDEAYELAKVFTHNEDYRAFYDVFDVLIDPADHSKADALKRALEISPKHYGFKLAQAINSQSPKDMLKLVEPSCAIHYAIPLIFTVLHHASSFEEACEINTRLGGASSDRGTLLGALMHAFDASPEAFNNKLTQVSMHG